MTTEPQKKKKKRPVSTEIEGETAATREHEEVAKELREEKKKETAAEAAATGSNPLARFAPIGFAAIGAVMLVIFGRSFLDASIGVLAAVAVVMLLAIFALWNSIRMLTGEMPVPEELAAAELRGTVPRAEKKRSILRALKDLENEHALGKIDDEDFKVVAGRYREEAKNLLRELDTEVAVYLPKAEALIQKHLKQKGLTQDPSPYREASRAASTETPAATESGTDVEKTAEAEDVTSPAPIETVGDAVKAIFGDDFGTEKHGRVVCEKCQTRNDTDAKFCKSCGQTMKKEEATDAT